MSEKDSAMKKTVGFAGRDVGGFGNLGSVPGFVLCGTGCGFLCGEGESRS